MPHAAEEEAMTNNGNSRLSAWFVRTREQMAPDLLLLFPLFLLKCVLLFHVYHSGFRMLMNDEPIRYRMSLSWMNDPYFAPWDHVWLGGHFALIGSYMKVFGSSFASLKLFVAFASFAGIAGAYYLGKHLYESRAAGFVAGLVLLGGYIHTWLSASVMPEIFVIGFTLCGAAWFLWGLKGQRHWAMLLGSASLGLSCSFRYEQWFMTALFDVMLLVLVLTRMIRVWVFVACGVLSAWYVVAWCISSQLRLGSPFAFLNTVVSVTEKAGPNPFSFIADQIRWSEPVIFGLGILSGIVLAVFGDRYQRGYAAWILAFSVVFPITMKTGVAMSVWRIIQGWRAILVMAVPVLLILPLRWLPTPGWRAGLTGGAVVVGLIYAAQQSSKARDIPHWEFPTANLAVAEWILFEKVEPQTFKKYDHPNIVYLSRGEGMNEGEAFAIIAYLSQYRRINIVGKIDRANPPEIVITRKREPIEGYHATGWLGDFVIWEIGEKPVVE